MKKSDLRFVNGFDAPHFLEYMRNTFNIDSFAREMLENAIQYGTDNSSWVRHQSAFTTPDFLERILPSEVRMSEILAFCEDKFLSEVELALKKAFWEKFEEAL